MAREVRPAKDAHRSTGQRRAAARASQEAADLAVRNAREDACKWKQLYESLYQSLHSNAEVGRRLALAAPHLAALLSGEPIADEKALIRNVGLHSRDVPDASAPLCEWRRSQKGPRLGAQSSASNSCLDHLFGVFNAIPTAATTNAAVGDLVYGI